MPPELVRFKESLRVLDLGRAYSFATPEYSTVLGQLTKLADLRYDDANFISHEGVPTDIGNLKELVAYGAARTLYTGPLNETAFQADMTALGTSPSRKQLILLLLSSFQLLAFIDIETNFYNSEIPVTIGDLPSLRFFYIRNCGMTGSIDFMEQMTSIGMLSLLCVSRKWNQSGSLSFLFLFGYRNFVGRHERLWWSPSIIFVFVVNPD